MIKDKEIAKKAKLFEYTIKCHLKLESNLFIYFFVKKKVRRHKYEKTGRFK